MVLEDNSAPDKVNLLEYRKQLFAVVHGSWSDE